MLTNNSWNTPDLTSDGQLLIGSSTGRPIASQLTSSANTLTIQTGHGSINIDLVQPVSAVYGGTGLTLLTTHGILIGEGSNSVNVTAAGTNGQILIASSTGDPAFSTITSTGGTLTFTFGYNSLNVDIAIDGFTFLSVWPVQNGGTGQTILTTHGILIGEGSNSVNVTAAGTNGQILIASSTGDPAFSTITSTGGTLTFTFGYNSLNVDIAIDGFTFLSVWPVQNGGTGQTILTTYGVLIGEGSNNVHVTAAGTNGQVLIASSTGDPAFSSITSTGGTLTFTFGYNSLNVDIAIAGFTFLSVWPVQNGGTGQSILTTYGVLIGEGSNNVHVTAAGTNGQVLIASSTGDPAFSSITSTGGTLTFTFGYNSLNVDIAIDGFTFLSVWPVQNGGTGQTILTTYGVLIGEGSNNVHVTAAGTNGQVLIASSTGDPAFSSITSTGGTLTFTFGYNSLNVDIAIAGFTFLSVWPVQNGGTGQSILTTYGVLIGEGSNNVHVTAAGTNGQVLIASSTGDPAFSSITSTGGTLTFTFGYNSLNVDIAIDGFTFLSVWPVQNGGTGQSILTTYGVLIGEGSNNVHVTAAGTNGQVLIASSTGDPAFSSITSTGGTLTFTFGYNSLNVDIAIAGFTFLSVWPVQNGGTGQTILTTYGVLIGEGSNNVHVTAAGTNGQVLIASSTGDPAFSSITSTGGTLTFTFGYNSLNVDIAIDGFTFLSVWPVQNGGTGQSILTTYGVLIGEGSNNVHVTAAGTNGQVLIASSTGDPAFSSITSTGGTLTFTFGYNSLNVDIAIDGFTFLSVWPVQNGGTGQSILTTYGVLIGEGSNNVHVTAAGTNGQVLISSSTGDPAFSSITSTGGTLTFTFGYNSLNVDIAIAGFTFLSVWPVQNGGTGQTILTTYGVLIGEGSNNVHVTAAGTNGQVLIASSTGDPAFSSITSTGGTLTFTFGYNSLNVDIAIAGFTFLSVWPVQNGGTGQSILTTYGVLIGEGSNNVHVTAAGTNGQVLIASSTGDPAFSSITSTGGTLTFTFGYNSLNVDIAIAGFTFLSVWPVQNGGTGQTILTTYGVLIGEGSNNVHVTAAGTNGQVLIASSTGDPAFSSITSTGGTLTFTFGYNSLNVDIAIDGFTFLSVWPVQNGGTGQTILTTYGVLIGEGSNNVNVTAAGTNGQVLIASSTGDPAFSSITSTGGTLTFTFGYNSLNVDIAIDGFTFLSVWPVQNGGTGQTILTTYGVLIGEGSNNVNVTAAGTDGQVLIASTTGDPAFSTITSTGGTLTFTFGNNSLNVDIAIAGFTFLSVWPVQNGGTGRTILTTYGVLIGEGSNNVHVTAAGTNGQVLIGSSTGDPKFNRITSTGGSLTFTFGYNSLNVDIAIAGFTFLSVWPVQNGGTGRSILTAYGVLIGEGSNNVNVTAAGTDGQVLIASTTGDPAFSTITSTGGTLTFTFGNNSLNVDIAIDGFTFLSVWPVQNGGTGQTILTTYGVLIGEGSNNVNVTAAGTNGQVLIASSTGDPAFSTITSTGGTLTFTFGNNSLNVDIAIDGFTFLNPWPVQNGGTGQTILTTYGVLIGEGSNNVNVTAAGTNGQILIASSTGDPAFATITSTGGTVAFTYGYNSLNIDVNVPGFTFLDPWPVQNGGTGRTILTTYGVLIGEGSNKIDVTAAGTDGQLLIAGTSVDPAFATITSALGTITFTFGPNSLSLDVNAPGFTYLNPWPVQNGGTGRTILTTYGVLIGEGSNNIDVTAAGTDGQVLLAASGADPAFSTLVSSSGTIQFTPGANSLGLDVVGGGIPWIYTTGPTVSIAYNTGYIVDGSNPVTLFLPETAPQGSVIRIHGMGSGLWSINQNPSVTQTVRIGYLLSNSATATAVQSTSIGDSLELLCVTANTQFDGLSVQGNLQMFT